MKKFLLSILLFFSVLSASGQYGQDSTGIAEINIRTGEEKTAFKVDYAINPDIKALPVKADGSKDEIAESGDYTLAKGENSKYTFVLTDSEGNEHKAEADTMPATIEDKDGNTYEVNEKGEVKPVSKNSDVKLDPATRDRQSDVAVLSFKATDNTKYALDEYRDVYENVTGYNEQYKAEGTAITASAKFMLPGASDEISVYIKENGLNRLVPEKVHFVTGKEYRTVYDKAAQTWRKFHGEKFMFDNMKTRGDDFVRQIQKFEAVFDDGANYTADLRLKPGSLHPNGLSLEYKSWKKSTFGTLMKGDQFKNQLKNYIKSGNFEYVIDGQKLIKDGVADPTKFVRGEFHEVFKKNTKALFDENQDFFKQFERVGGSNVRNYADFDKLVKDKSFQEQIGKFVSVE